MEHMKEERLPRKLLFEKPGGNQKLGRSRNRWLGDVEGDLSQLGVRGWRAVTAD